MSIVVIPADPGHAEIIARLMQEMDHFYGAPEVAPLEVSMRQIAEAVFTDPPAARVVLAFLDEQPVGFASYSFLWPAVGLTRSLYLKELYTTKGQRRVGVGNQLMWSIFNIAVRNDCSRVEWTTDLDNLDALHFYKKLGVSINSSKLFYRLEGDELRRAVDFDASDPWVGSELE